MSPKWVQVPRGWGTRTMNNTVFTLEIANARSAELIEEARRHGLAKRARRRHGHMAGQGTYRTHWITFR